MGLKGEVLIQQDWWLYKKMERDIDLFLGLYHVRTERRLFINRFSQPLDLGLSGSRAVGGKFLFSKPLSVQDFVLAAGAD